MPTKGRGNDCLWCYSRLSKNDVYLCPECLGEMRRALGITREDLVDMKLRGFFRATDLDLKLNKALSGLDQLEAHHWLDNSLKQRAGLSTSGVGDQQS